MRDIGSTGEDCCSWEEVYELFGCPISFDLDADPAFHPDE